MRPSRLGVCERSLRAGVLHRHALAASVLLLCVQSIFASTADDLRSLPDQGKSAEACALGNRSPEARGDPDVDFYFGIAATDTGHAGQGVLALERHGLTCPDNHTVRLQLAGGYFALGEDVRRRLDRSRTSRRCRFAAHSSKAPMPRLQGAGSRLHGLHCRLNATFVACRDVPAALALTGIKASKLRLN